MLPVDDVVVGDVDVGELLVDQVVVLETWSTTSVAQRKAARSTTSSMTKTAFVVSKMHSPAVSKTRNSFKRLRLPRCVKLSVSSREDTIGAAKRAHSP